MEHTPIASYGDFNVIRHDFTRPADSFYTVRDARLGLNLSYSYRRLANARRVARQQHSRRTFGGQNGSTVMTSIELPGYIDPAVLVPGQRVVCILDGSETTLTVLKVEPALMCSRPDGSVVLVLAHTVIPMDDDEPASTPAPEVPS